MKKMTKIVLALLLLSSMAFAGGGSQKKKPRPPRQKTLVEQGLSLISLTGEKAADENFARIFSGDEEVGGVVREIASQNFSKPSAVYRLGGDFSACFSLLSGALRSEGVEFSPALEDDLAKRFLASFPSMWNARKAGAESLAAASVLGCTKAFVSKELSEDCVFVYEFNGSYPVAVCFLRGEDNAVMATSTVVLDRNFIESLKESLSEFGVLSVEKLQ